MISISPLNNVHLVGDHGNFKNKNTDEIINIKELKNLKIFQIVKFKKNKKNINDYKLSGLDFPGKLKVSENKDIRIIGVDAYGSILKKYHETGELDTNEIHSYRIEGMGKNIVPSATDFNIIDKFVKVTDSESAHMARNITLNEGIFVGYTSGAAMQAAKQLDEEGEFDKNSNIVIVFADHGSRYLSKIYSDEWMNNQGFYDSSFYQPKKNSINYI